MALEPPESQRLYGFHQPGGGWLTRSVSLPIGSHCLTDSCRKNEEEEDYLNTGVVIQPPDLRFDGASFYRMKHSTLMWKQILIRRTLLIKNIIGCLVQRESVSLSLIIATYAIAHDCLFPQYQRFKTAGRA